MNAKKFAVFAITASLTLTPMFARGQQLWTKNQALAWPDKQSLAEYNRQVEYLSDEQTVGFIVGAIHFKAAFLVEAQPVTSLLEDKDSVTIRLNDGRELVTTSAMLEYK